MASLHSVTHNLTSSPLQGVRLLLLKNPWSHLRWRGNYSERDTEHWTPQLQKALNYDVNSARLTDNGKVDARVVLPRFSSRFSSL